MILFLEIIQIDGKKASIQVPEIQCYIEAQDGITFVTTKDDRAFKTRETYESLKKRLEKINK